MAGSVTSWIVFLELRFVRMGVTLAATSNDVARVFTGLEKQFRAAAEGTRVFATTATTLARRRTPEVLAKLKGVRYVRCALLVDRFGVTAWGLCDKPAYPGDLVMFQSVISKDNWGSAVVARFANQALFAPNHINVLATHRPDVIELHKYGKIFRYTKPLKWEGHLYDSSIASSCLAYGGELRILDPRKSAIDQLRESYTEAFFARAE